MRRVGHEREENDRTGVGVSARWYRERTAATTRSGTRMHLVISAWLFVIFTMSLTMRSLLVGIALFAALGVAPVALYMLIAVRRARRLQRERSPEEG